MRFTRTLVKLIPLLVAGALLVSGAVAGCSGGYGDPTGPDTAQVNSAAGA